MDDIDLVKRLATRLNPLTEFTAFNSAKSLHDSLQKRAFEVPRELISPPRDHLLPKLPTPREANDFQGAGVLVRRLAETVGRWREHAPAGAQPVVIAMLPNGAAINVELLAEESFHGIRVEGTIDGQPCMLLTHQASIQLLCVMQKVEPKAPKRQIGFIIAGERSEA